MAKSFPLVVSLLAALLGGAKLGVDAARAERDSGLSVELNKLAQREGACRVYLVLDNATEHHFTALRLDLVFFDREGGIARRLGVDAAPLRPGKTFAKVFDVQGLRCDAIRRVLFNGALACETRGSATPACTALARPRSRLDTAFIK